MYIAMHLGGGDDDDDEGTEVGGARVNRTMR